MTFSTLTEGLDANRSKDRRIFFIDGDNRRRSITFSELHQRALGLLSHLHERGLSKGDHPSSWTNAEGQEGGEILEEGVDNEGK